MRNKEESMQQGHLYSYDQRSVLQMPGLLLASILNIPCIRCCSFWNSMSLTFDTNSRCMSTNHEFWCHNTWNLVSWLLGRILFLVASKKCSGGKTSLPVNILKFLRDHIFRFVDSCFLFSIIPFLHFIRNDLSRESIMKENLLSLKGNIVWDKMN